MTDFVRSSHESTMRPKTSLLVAVVAIVGCQHQVTIEPEGPATITKRISESNQLDLLFVIDDSTSTSDKQVAFANNLSAFVTALDAFPLGRPSLHIAVVSTSIAIGSSDSASYGEECTASPGEDGLLQNTERIPGCTAPNGRFISDIAQPDGTRQTNYAGTLPDTLACIGELGEQGCGFESPLEAIKRALDGSHPENAGFLRDNADLGIVILTDEDDCSANPSLFDHPTSDAGPSDLRCALYGYTCDRPIDPTLPESYANCAPTLGGDLRDPSSYSDFLATLKDPSQTVVAVVGGDITSGINTGPLTIGGNTQSLAVEPSCNATINGNLAIARPGIRLGAFSDMFGDHGIYETVCQADYSGALTAIGDKLFTMMSPCIEGDISIVDVDVANPGLQPACTVTENGVDMPACAMLNESTPAPNGTHPCWWLDSAPVACADTATGLQLNVARDRDAPPDGLLTVSCATP